MHSIALSITYVILWRGLLVEKDRFCSNACTHGATKVGRATQNKHLSRRIRLKNTLQRLIGAYEDQKRGVSRRNKGCAFKHMRDRPHLGRIAPKKAKRDTDLRVEAYGRKKLALKGRMLDVLDMLKDIQPPLRAKRGAEHRKQVKGTQR